MEAVKGGFLKKLNIISSIKKGLALHHLNPTTNKRVEDEDISSSVDSEDDFEDANLSAPESIELSLSGRESCSTDSEPCSPRLPDQPTGSVVFYSTSLRGVRKTFEDCSRIRFLLRSSRVKFEERDVSMHREYIDELRRVMNGRGEGSEIVLPKLFVRGQLVGGADEVVGMHERGELKELLEGIPIDHSTGDCGECGNFRFVICSRCSGSCRVISDSEKRIECTDCNENGLVRCRIC